MILYFVSQDLEDRGTGMGNTYESEVASDGVDGSEAGVHGTVRRVSHQTVENGPSRPEQPRRRTVRGLPHLHVHLLSLTSLDLP